MPIYEYRCGSCNRVIEKRQHFSDPPLTTCSECGGSLEKLISAPNFQLKGTGWYVTDYAKNGKNGHKSPEAQKPTEKSESKKETVSKTDSSATASSTKKKD